MASCSRKMLQPSIEYRAGLRSPSRGREWRKRKSERVADCEHYHDEIYLMQKSATVVRAWAVVTRRHDFDFVSFSSITAEFPCFVQIEPGAGRPGPCGIQSTPRPPPPFSCSHKYLKIPSLYGKSLSPSTREPSSWE